MPAPSRRTQNVGGTGLRSNALIAPLLTRHHRAARLLRSWQGLFLLLSRWRRDVEPHLVNMIPGIRSRWSRGRDRHDLRNYTEDELANVVMASQDTRRSLHAYRRTERWFMSGAPQRLAACRFGTRLIGGVVTPVQYQSAAWWKQTGGLLATLAQRPASLSQSTIPEHSWQRRSAGSSAPWLPGPDGHTSCWWNLSAVSAR